MSIKRELSPAERLIVAADFKPDKKEVIQGKVMALAADLKGTGVSVKVESALRICGYELIDKIHQMGVPCFADLKLVGTRHTLGLDGAFLRRYHPEIVTVSCAVGVKALAVLKHELPDTEVLGVTVLTSLDEDDVQHINRGSVLEVVMHFAQMALDAGLDGLISAPAEVCQLRRTFGRSLSINTPDIRPAWVVIEDDDQNPKRVMTPTEAMKADIDRIVVGRPIVESKNPYDAVMSIIEEIDAAMAPIEL
ncbi:MAG: orotidine 5'-phosphate decarboxylase / HUMPS family protein [Patescibacteria group bacterium]